VQLRLIVYFRGRCCRGLLEQALVGGLAAEAAMGAMVVVEVLPFLDLVVEQLCVVDEDAFELAVELLGVDAVGAFDFAVEARCGGLDVDVADCPRWRRWPAGRPS
jgi:hypothetical protein